MARVTKAMIAQAEADNFRATVISLRNIKHPDWNDWEWNWLNDEAVRKADYLYTETERAVLDKLTSAISRPIDYATIP